MYITSFIFSSYLCATFCMCCFSHEELAKELIDMSSLQMEESVNTSLLKTVSDNLKKEISEHEPFNHWMFDKVFG